MYRERGSFRIGLPAAASLAVNALLAAALLSLSMGGDGRKAVQPSMTVMSLAAVKGADEGQEEEANAVEQGRPVATSAPATTSPAPSAPSPQKAQIRPPIMADLLAISPAKAGPPFSAVASASHSVPPQSAPARSPATAVASSARHGAADGLDVKAPPGNSRGYAARVRSWLYAHKTYPRRARMRREEGVVKVRFIIDRTGTLLQGNIIEGSGNGALDEEAMATLRRASPFPEAPSDVPGEHIEFTVPIEFALAT